MTKDEDEKIACRICGARTHIMRLHLKEQHPTMSEAEYQATYPDAPMLSALALRRLEENRARGAGASTLVASPIDEPMALTPGQGALHEVFGLGKAKGAFNGRTGEPLMVTTIKAGPGLAHFVPDRDSSYIFQLPLLKLGLMALETRQNAYFWGHAGTGKSTIWEQICAFTGRPMIRIQHTRNTEESHVIGEKTVEDGNVRFVLGPLAFAMKHGLVYLADEYDFAMPSVLSVYQPVLEGKPLVIKEADEANRVIRPHPLFRFVATGNTNGQGDETGLYQGTLLQNAANYERFGVVEEVKYMDPAVEVGVIVAQARIPKSFAEKIVNFATACREAFAAQKLGLPPSPRAMINAAKNGEALGDFAEGLRKSYINRLSRVDAVAANELLKRIAF